MLRLIFAGMVLWLHVNFVGGFGPDWITTASRGQVEFGELGILGLFAISGFLIAASYAGSPSVGGFIRKRILRIFPGFYANLLVTALVIAPLICLSVTGSLAAYPWMGPDGAFHYILVNAGLQVKAWHIGPSPPNPGTLDGALWSLWPEFLCYLGLLVLGGCGALRERRLYVLMVTAGFYAFYVISVVVGGEPYPLIPTFIALGPARADIAFGVGACVWAFREHLPADRRIALLLGAGLLACAKFGGWKLAAPVLFPLFLLQVAQCFRVRLRHDFSYGIYIYHFPVAKLLATFPFFSRSLGVFLSADVILTLALAAFSWFGVERHFLHRTGDALKKQRGSAPAG